MDLNFLFSSVVSICCIALAILAIIPLPFKLRLNIVRKLSRLVLPLIIIIALLLIGAFGEWDQQRKFNIRRKESALGQAQTHFFNASEYFKHQRNMYIYLLAIILVLVFITLIRNLHRFMSENNILREQLRVRQSVNNVPPPRVED